MSAQKLEALRADLEKRGTRALMIIRNDRVVMEWYAQGTTANTKNGTASLAKSLIGGMSLAVTMQDGLIKPEDKACDFIPEWKADPRKSRITVGQLATHSSGLEDAEDKVGGLPHEKLPGWKGAFWRREPDPFTISRDQTPVIYEPGEKISYSNPGMAMLSYTITAALVKGNAKQKDVRSLLAERIMRPIGVADGDWSAGYGKVYRVNDLDLIANWGGGAFTIRSAARVGRLMLRRGDWEGKQVLDAAIVDRVMRYDAAPHVEVGNGKASPYKVLGWYTNIDKTWTKIPRDAMAGGGAGHQMMLIVPSLDLIVVRNGTLMAPADKESFWEAAEKHLFEPAVLAVTDPIPPSDVIRKVSFDSPEKIVRAAPDSDNWPMTWGDDDAIYTSYGDGRGFEPFVEKKLSQGLARIEGGPGDFRGVNLRSESAERTGGGANGPKASGMLMVDGVLYMWVRNTRNATLAWSADRGKTWTWGMKFEESFGCPAFLNFGKNYEGARDEFVYVYSQDGPIAYEPYDRIALARVPKGRVKEKEAYEYFVRLDQGGQAIWSSQLGERGGTLAYPEHCERVDVAYDKGLGRYLLAMGFGHGKGWGLYDAPQPWGPWSMAFSTPDWGLGETHGYRLPTKWMSADGLTIPMVFSGRKENDAFCVRRMMIEKYP